MKYITVTALACLATCAAAAPTPKPFHPIPGDFNLASIYNDLFPSKLSNKLQNNKDKIVAFGKGMVKPYKYEEALKWDGAGLEPYDWSFNLGRRPFRHGDPKQSNEDRKKKEDDDRKKKEDEERKKKDDEERKKKEDEERKKKEDEERKKKEDEERNKNNKDGKWNIKNFERKCSNGDKDCTVKFEIEQPGKSASKCEYKIENDRKAISDHKCNDNGNEYIIGAQWSGQFGDGNGFTTLSVVDQKNRRIVWPAYTDKELEGGKTVSPDKAYPSQELPK